MPAKRTTLPPDFQGQLRTATLPALIAVFERCEVNATTRTADKTPTLGLAGCPDELTEWLLAAGANLEQRNARGETPLMCRSRRAQDNISILLEHGAATTARDPRGSLPLHAAAAGAHPQHVRTLLEHGAKAEAVNQAGASAMDLLLAQAHNANLVRVAETAAALLAAGVQVSDSMQAAITRIGTTFEFYRADFNAETLPAADSALQQLYRLFMVPPAPQRQIHDDTSPITLTATTWQQQHAELWGKYVPGKGAATTVQGEVIRISGRIAHEILDNGGVNWDADYRKMLDACLTQLASGTPLPAVTLARVKDLAAQLDDGRGDKDQVYPLSEACVAWVLANPNPIPLAKPSYSR